MCEYFCLENSCLTLALKKDFTFISAFPGFLTFGFVAKTHYKKTNIFTLVILTYQSCIVQYCT